MKNLKTFLTALLIGTFMIVWYNVFLLLTNDLDATSDQDKVGLLLQQAVIVVKFFSISIVAMPSSVNVKQLVAGYIAADLLFVFPMFWDKYIFSFLVEMLIAQAVLSVIYSVSERRASANPIQQSI